MTGPVRVQKRPVVVEAMQMPTTKEGGMSAVRPIAEWMVDNGFEVDVEWTRDIDPNYIHSNGEYVLPEYGVNFIEIETLEGTMTARLGDWVIRGVQGEFYPCKPDVFAETYLVLDDEGSPDHG